MRKFRRLKLALAGLLVLCITAGLLALRAPQQEIFPFYSWFLFALTPGQTDKFGLRLLEADGKRLPEPLFYEEADGLVRAPHAVSVQKVIQQLGAAVGRNDEARVKELRGFLERAYLPRGTAYEIVRLRYNPIERWKTGREEITPVAHWEAGNAAP